MTTFDDESLREVFSRAADLVGTLPPALQVCAFARAVEILLGQAESGTRRGNAQGSGPRRRAKSPRGAFRSGRRAADNVNADDSFALLVSSTMPATNWEIVWEAGTPLDRWLAALAVAEAEAQILGLNARQIERLLVDRFRLAGVHASNIGRDLRAQPKLVTKSEAEGRVTFSLTRNGMRQLERRLETLKREPPPHQT